MQDQSHELKTHVSSFWNLFSWQQLLCYCCCMLFFWKQHWHFLPLLYVWTRLLLCQNLFNVSQPRAKVEVPWPRYVTSLDSESACSDASSPKAFEACCNFLTLAFGGLFSSPSSLKGFGFKACCGCFAGPLLRSAPSFWKGGIRTFIRVGVVFTFGLAKWGAMGSSWIYE